MRILLIADVHGNWPALQAAAAEPHDVCVFLGDLVDYALEPAPCIDWVREHAPFAVRGNHDHGVAQNPGSGSANSSSGSRGVAWTSRKRVFSSVVMHVSGRRDR